MRELNPLSPYDDEIVNASLQRLEQSFDEPVRSVAAAARLKNGDIVTGMNFKHYAFTACAEMAILSVVQNTTESPIELISSVRYINDEPEVINACGRCRQVLADCFPDIKFVVNDDKKLAIATVKDVLPLTYIHYPGGKR